MAAEIAKKGNCTSQLDQGITQIRDHRPNY